MTQAFHATGRPVPPEPRSSRIRPGLPPHTPRETNLNKKWPHGVGTRNAKDKGGSVTNFYRNNKAYWAAENHNGTLDRDNDRIACEKA